LQAVHDSFGVAPKWTFSVDRADAAYVAYIDCDVDNNHVPAGEADISYAGHPGHRGQGNVSRAVRLITQFLRDHTDSSFAWTHWAGGTRIGHTGHAPRENAVETGQPGYQLGHDARELDRLNQQGRLLAPATRVLLEAAGLRPGMRVLDLGSGSGDLAFVVTELVGPGGVVVGVERSPEAVDTARARACHLGLVNARFTVGDIREATADGPFDAIVGRLVLMYLPDPAAVLRTQITLLRPDGLIAPIEFDLSTARSLPSTPLVSQSLGWLGETFKRAGIQPSLGSQLWAILRAADVRPLGMMGVQPHFGPDDPAGPGLLAGIVRTMLPVIEQTGVATAQQVAVETLQHRLAAEMTANGAVFAHPILLSAWGRLS
jgi:SAM-dependent methyltransferase